jgi:hypothetical protein
MSPALFIIIAYASYPAILAVDGSGGTNLIQGSVSRNGFTHYITGNLTPPGGTVYIMRLNANGSFLSNQSKQPAYVLVTDTFFGWGIPA